MKDVIFLSRRKPGEVGIYYFDSNENKFGIVCHFEKILKRRKRKNNYR